MPLNIHLPQPLNLQSVEEIGRLFRRLGLTDPVPSQEAEGGPQILHIDSAVTVNQEITLRRLLPAQARLERPEPRPLNIRFVAREIGPVCVQLADVFESCGHTMAGCSYRETGDCYWCYEVVLKMSRVSDAVRDEILALLDGRLDVKLTWSGQTD